MASITCKIVDKLRFSNDLAVWLSYNNEASCSAGNKAAIAKFSNIAGLPSLTRPICVEDVRVAATGQLFGNGKAIILPPGVCFNFLIAKICNLGFGMNVTLLPANVKIKQGHYYWRDQGLSVGDWFTGRLPTWSNGNTLKVSDGYLKASNILSAELAKYFSNSFQIKIDTWPMISYESPRGTLHSIPRGGRTIDTHKGTVIQGQPSTTKYSTVYNLKDNKSSVTTAIFNILVLNSKYYTNELLKFNS